MKVSKVFVAALFAIISWAHASDVEGVAVAAERVGGASLIAECDDLQSVLFDVVGNDLKQSEVDLLLENADDVFAWANENSEQWLSADSSENPWRAIESFPLWREVEITGAEFVAIVSKLMFYSEYQNMAINAESIIAERDQMRGFLESPELPADARPQVEAMIKQADGMIHIIENVLPNNKPVFAKNKEAIDGFLEQMESVGESDESDEDEMGDAAESSEETSVEAREGAPVAHD